MTAVDAMLDMAVQMLAQQARSQQADSARIRHGTVQDTHTGGIGIHDVLVDGDDSPIGVHDITMGFPLVIGDRVTVLFAAPHQALIIGKVPFSEAGNVITINQYTPQWQTSNFAGTHTPIQIGIGGTQYGWYVDLFGFVLGIAGFNLGTGGTLQGINGEMLNVTMPVPLHPTFRNGGLGEHSVWGGFGRAYDNNPGVFWSSTGQVGDPWGTGTLMFNFATAGQTAWDVDTPFGWIIGDRMSALFIYPREPG